MEPISVAQSPPGRSVQSHRPGKQHVAREQRAVDGEREMAGRMARHRDDVEPDAGEVEGLSSFEKRGRRPCPDVQPGGSERGGILEQSALGSGCEGRRAGALREVCKAENVVEVAVRDENRRTPCAVGGERKPDVGRRPARIDHDGLGRAPLGSYEVAVRL